MMTEPELTTQCASGRRMSLRHKMGGFLNSNKRDEVRVSHTECQLEEGERTTLLARLNVRRSSVIGGARTGSPTSPTSRKSALSGRSEVVVDSAPVVLHGQPDDSSGALISGRLKFSAEGCDSRMIPTTLHMVLRSSFTTSKPVVKDCPDCTTRSEDLKEWTFIVPPNVSEAEFPWLYLLDGGLPATTQCQSGSIAYALFVFEDTSDSKTLACTHPLHVSRTVTPEPDKTEARIFPPTHLRGCVTRPPVIHPVGKFEASMKLTGIAEEDSDSDWPKRWQLRRCLWRVEEHSSVQSTSCDKHRHILTDAASTRHEEVKQLGSGKLKSGWTTCFDAPSGEVTLDLEVQLSTKPDHQVCCDVECPSKLSIKHILVIELVIEEEVRPPKGRKGYVASGLARILRMQFGVLVADRAGAEVSWDKEVPPLYDQVPESPPVY